MKAVYFKSQAEWGKKIARAYPLLPYHHCALLTRAGHILDLTVDGFTVYEGLTITSYLENHESTSEWAVTLPPFKVDEAEAYFSVIQKFTDKRVDPTAVIGNGDFAVRVRPDGISWLQLINKPGVTLCTDIVWYTYNLREPVTNLRNDETDPVSF